MRKFGLCLCLMILVAGSADSQTFKIRREATVVAGTTTGYYYIYDEAGTLLRTDDLGNEILTVDVRRSGKRIAIGADYGAATDKIHLFHRNLGTIIPDNTIIVELADGSAGRGRETKSLSMCANGSKIAVASPTATSVYSWNQTSPDFTHTGGCYCVDISANGRYVASRGAGQVRLFDTTSPTPESPLWTSTLAGGFYVAVSNRGDVITSHGDSIRIYTTDPTATPAGALAFAYKHNNWGENNYIRVDISDDGHLAIAANYDIDMSNDAQVVCLKDNFDGASGWSPGDQPGNDPSTRPAWTYSRNTMPGSDEYYAVVVSGNGSRILCGGKMGVHTDSFDASGNRIALCTAATPQSYDLSYDGYFKVCGTENVVGKAELYVFKDTNTQPAFSKNLDGHARSVAIDTYFRFPTLGIMPAGWKIQPRGPGVTLDMAFPETHRVELVSGQPVRYTFKSKTSDAEPIIIEIQPDFEGGALLDAPRMHYKLHANSLYNPYRLYSLEGDFTGDLLPNPDDGIVDRYAFDLPDEGFFYPGDLLHYYIAIETEDGVATLPDDLTGFGVMPDDPGYDILMWGDGYSVRGLPTVKSSLPGDQPEILVWCDDLEIGDADEMMLTMRMLGFTAGDHYDILTTGANGDQPANSLDGLMKPSHIAAYQTIIYSCGTSDLGTLSSGEESNDLQMLDTWLLSGERNLLCLGDNLCADLNTVPEGFIFSETWLGAQFISNDIAPLLGTRSPEVRPMPGNPVFSSSWFLSGYCCRSGAGPRLFDYIAPMSGSLALAQFMDDSGIPSGIPAAILRQTEDDRIITLPYGFMAMRSELDDDLGTLPDYHGRAAALGDILRFFGHEGEPPYADTPTLDRFAVDAHPNPFNPATTFNWTLPAASDFSIRIYDLKGRLVKTIHEGRTARGPGEATWNGTDAKGDPSPAGVYCFRAETPNASRIGKLTLIK